MFACGSDDEKEAEWCLCCDRYVPRRSALMLPKYCTHCVLSATWGCFRGLTAGMCCVVMSVCLYVCVLVPVFPLIFIHMFLLKSKEDGSCSAWYRDMSVCC